LLKLRGKKIEYITGIPLGYGWRY